MNIASRGFRFGTSLLGLAMGLFGLVVLTGPAASADINPVAGTPATVSADALPTWQVNGVVWAQVIVGNTVYVTGSFTQARPPGVGVGGAGSVAANNVFAYDITTGNRVASFNHSLNGQGLAIAASPDGSRVYVGGDFTTVDGAARNHLAAFATSDNSLVGSFTASVSSRVGAIAVSSSSVYVGGNFFSVNGASRTRLAKISTSSGAVDSTFKPSVDDNVVTALALTPDGSKLVVGGRFTSMNATANVVGMGAVDTTSGALLPWAANQTIRDGISAASASNGTGCGITSLRTDGTSIYGAGYSYNCGNFEGSFKLSPSDGSIVLANDCHGDTYDVAPVGGVLYTVSHAHDCRWMGAYPQTDSNWSINMRHALAFTTDARGVNTGPDNYGWNYNGIPASQLLQWYPTVAIGSVTGQNQAAWAVAGNSQYVVLGGEFPSVNGTAQQGLVRFASPTIAPDKRGPTKVTSSAAPNAAPQNVGAVAMPDGSVRVTWQSAVDQDNATLSYSLFRSGTAAAINTQTASSNFWTYPMLGFRDTGAKAGTSYTYTVKATDSSGNTTNLGSTTVTATAGNGTGTSAYSADVVKDGATAYWPMSESSGTTAYDYAGFNDATVGSGVTRGAAGPIAGDPSTASGFNGSDAGNASSPAMPTTPAFSVEAWIKTTSTTGGKIIGYGNSATGDSSSYDRHVYMDNSGRIWFGVYPNAVKTLNSTKSYNDGSWHHIVATEGAGGTALYVDGRKVGSDTSTTSAQTISGFWRIGGDNLGGWPSTGGVSSNDFTGSIADVAVYPTALSAAQAQQHYTDAGGTSTGVAPPTDAYGKAVYGSQPDLYWRLNESGGSTALDSSGNQENGVLSGGVTPGQGSGVAGGGSAYAFNGSDGTIASQDAVSNPTTYSEELWFKTSTTHGGKLIGLGDAQSGTSGNYDRHVYMENSGQLTFGTWTGQANTITSPSSYNDNAWHYMVATQGPDGMKLYVDGVLVGTNPQTQAQSFSGYWRVGGDSDWGGDSPFFSGTIDEVAVYGSVLTQNAISAHYQAGGGAVNTAPTAAFTSAPSKLKASFDASGSTDDGALTYAWDFGDGSSGSGVSPSHTYASAGSYTVKLTVTDAGGLTDSVTHSVTVSNNAAPTASFTAATTNLKVDVDGSGSTDSDGSVVSYAWDFGDGTSGTGVTTSHTYAANGTYTVKLTVTDDDAATNSSSQQVTVTKANQPPVASYTLTPTDLSVAADGSGSSDPDGSVVSYGWNWGDGTTDGTGAKPSHTYASAGTYSVKLTVTDDKGATDSLTKSVTVAAPASTVLASDAFNRTVSNGWGSADVGGAWALEGASANFSVGNGLGNLLIPKAGAGPWAYLSGLSSSATDTVVQFSTDSTPTGNGTYLYLIGRQIGSASGGYRLAVNLRANGTVSAVVNRRLASGTESAVSPAVMVTGLTYAPGTYLNARFVVSGNGTTVLRAKVWAAGTSEPNGWLIDTSDTTAALQAPGSVGLMGYLAGNATSAPVTVRFQKLTVNAAQ